ncbi:LAFE_0G05644g1_1 [Lachancea fermentati]|uniref:LAFE_0G05644g1_1 n=1 Tax=Lachancea fermentati TaxID=4955 RepID=A0A1G4MHK9_LACFM|nr:LAFE_0G05644g1_1 [Lachancea fermentati]
MLLRILIGFLWAIKLSAASGVGAHLTFLARTLVPEQFVPFTENMKAGCFFPDALYSCNNDKKWHDFAEACHWPGFLIQGIRLWQERYKRNKFSERSLKLQSFLIGVYTHQVADVSWHSLVKGYETHGLIKVLAGLEFDGDYQKAHDYIDTMGDLLVLGHVLRDLSDEWAYYTDQTWQLPEEEDLMELVHRMGLKSISYWQLNGCVKRGMVAASSEVYSLIRRRREILEVAYAISPRACELMQDHWLGGEFDIVAMINKCLPTFLSLFDDQSSNENELLSLLQICGNLPPAETRKISKSATIAIRKYSDLLYVSPLIPIANFGSSIAVGAFQNNETCVAISSPLEEGSGSVYVIPWSDFSGSEERTYLEPVVTSMYGKDVHKYTLGDSDYLVVSELGSNTIHFYYDGHKLFSIADKSSSEGHQMSVSSIQDIDGDGIPDIMLSGLHYGKNETGVVYIINGNDISALLGTSTYGEIELSSLSTILLRCPVSVNYQQFGSEIKVSSVWSKKGFLYVTSQGLGVVFAYCLCSLHQNALPRYYIIEDSIMLPEEGVPFNISIRPSIEHGMFGNTIHSWNFENENYVAISQHLKNSVFVYKEHAGFIEFYMRLQLDISEDSRTVISSIGFGTAMDYDLESNSLVVSSPGSFNGIGALWEIPMKEIIKAKEEWRFSQLLVTIPQHLLVTNGDLERHGIVGFGKVLKRGPDGRLIIGIPHYGYGNVGHDQLMGSVAIL